MIALTVEGISCGHCVAAVKEALAQVLGVQGVPVVSLEHGKVVVDGNVAVDALITAIESEGYTARAA